jgi:hypothetical protein
MVQDQSIVGNVIRIINQKDFSKIVNYLYPSNYFYKNLSFYFFKFVEFNMFFDKKTKFFSFKIIY